MTDFHDEISGLAALATRADHSFSYRKENAVASRRGLILAVEVREVLSGGGKLTTFLLTRNPVKGYLSTLFSNGRRFWSFNLGD